MKTNEEKKENNLEKDSVNNKKAHKKMTEEPDKDKNDTPSKLKTWIYPMKTTHHPLDHQFYLQGSNNIFNTHT